ncbi:FadR/GntR family transcriptional regulator [Paenibacillus sp. MBLB4367]|uniref:FadR/GntR family transcriptional regulator n=1 Tax=Paenibacillus sp. MBLB4367 TaxID=3384767 RepID=UPI003907E84C
MKGIRKETLSQQAGESIKAYIEQMRLQPGDKLPSEKQLIDRYGVSRTVVREALKSLETVGIIQMKPGDGIYVARPSISGMSHHFTFHWNRKPQTVKELLQIRVSLELFAIELTVMLRDEERIAQMSYWVEEMERKLKDGGGIVHEDLQFHRSLFRASGNDTLCELSEFIAGFFVPMEGVASTLHTPDPLSLLEHKQILHWIRAGDTEKAKACMRDHLRPLELFVASLEANPDGGEEKH